MKKLIAFFKDEDGLETSEYAVMGALIVTWYCSCSYCACVTQSTGVI